MFIALLAAAALSSDPNDAAGFAQFVRSQSLIYITETVDISIDRSERANPLQYKIRYRWRQQMNSKQIDVDSDSRDCPAIRQIVATMAKIPMPQPAPVLDSEPSGPPMLDGNYYELRVPSSFKGRVSITSNVGTPLAVWVDDALTALRPCVPPMPLP